MNSSNEILPSLPTSHKNLFVKLVSLSAIDKQHYWYTFLCCLVFMTFLRVKCPIWLYTLTILLAPDGFSARYLHTDRNRPSLEFRILQPLHWHEKRFSLHTAPHGGSALNILSYFPVSPNLNASSFRRFSLVVPTYPKWVPLVKPPECCYLPHTTTIVCLSQNVDTTDRKSVV